MLSDGALRHPLAALERAHEDPLRAARLLLERRPRHARAAGCERAADDVGDAGVLVGVDPVAGIVVDLRAVRRQADDRPGRRRENERSHDAHDARAFED